MKRDNLVFEKVEGKTYNLFGEYDFSFEYFELIKQFADYSLTLINDETKLLSFIREQSCNKKKLRKSLESNSDSIIEKILKSSEKTFAQFTANVTGHLSTVGLYMPFDKTIRTSLEQYYIYMLEIELTNKINKSSFDSAEYKLALLPHCIHDLEKECKSEIGVLDYQCRKCSQKCFIHYITQILEEKGIHPYIWREIKFKDIIKKLRRNNQTIGILGIACIPELARGMRMCGNSGIPAIGVPLNANRCRRWFGKFYDNSINIEEIEKLI